MHAGDGQARSDAKTGPPISTVSLPWLIDNESFSPNYDMKEQKTKFQLCMLN